MSNLSSKNIFISYRRGRTTNFARKLSEYLANFGFRVFWDEAEISPGEEIETSVAERLKHSASLIVLIGPDWNTDGKLENERDWVRMELESAYSHREHQFMQIIPVILGDIRLGAQDKLTAQANLGGENSERLIRTLRDLRCLEYPIEPTPVDFTEIKDALLADATTVLHLAHISDLNLASATQAAGNRPETHCRRLLSALTAELSDLKDKGQLDFVCITGDLACSNSQDDLTAAVQFLTGYAGPDFLNLRPAVPGANPSPFFVAVPGNTDRYRKDEPSLSFEKYFRPLEPGAIVICKGIPIRFHLIDSTSANGSTKGKIECKDLPDRPVGSDAIDIALLHHYLFYNPETPRCKKREIQNSSEAWRFLTGFHDLVLTGHQKKSYSSLLSPFRLTVDRRQKKRGLRFLKMAWSHLIEGSRKDRALGNTGKYVKWETYFAYLHLRAKGVDVKGPESFRSQSQYNKYLAAVYQAKSGFLKSTLEPGSQRQFFYSSVPSACQKREDGFEERGFHKIEIHIRDKQIRAIKCILYLHTGHGDFIPVRAPETFEVPKLGFFNTNTSVDSPGFFPGSKRDLDQW